MTAFASSCPLVPNPKSLPLSCPWLVSKRAKTHNPDPHCLEKLSEVDVERLINKLFAAHEQTLPERLAERIFRASDGGWPLFARNMIDSSIEALREGREVDFGESHESLLGYAKVGIDRLATLTDWRDLCPIFIFLTIAKQAVSSADLELILDKKIFSETFPSQLRRWLNVVHNRSGRNPPMLSFAHPLLAKVFGQQLEDRPKVAEKEFAKAISTMSFPDWPQYAPRHLPRHLLEMGLVDDTVRYLTDIEFITARFATLGTDDCLTAMKTHWMAWYGVALRRNQKPTDGQRDLIRHLRFWNNYSVNLSRTAAEEFDRCWLQMMHDVGLASASDFKHACPSITPSLTNTTWDRRISLVSAKPQVLPEPLATLFGHEGSVFGALILPDADGFLSWCCDGTLHI